MSETKVYSLKKTVAKGGLPIALVIAVKIAVEIAKSQGIIIDEGTALTVIMTGYGGLIGFLNWWKNRKTGRAVTGNGSK